ncbi:voltage-dependent T-type calcium channel subunit alpha-1I-like [Trichomycterus rosablanca]|uniref:voltage-dependent T-type calcium channel subunit alpha-1I-like n=1 Tax=Trichomycterus rosablanca TaxID=2290929 RepID=UPI002F354CA1
MTTEEEGPSPLGTSSPGPNARAGLSPGWEMAIAEERGPVEPEEIGPVVQEEEVEDDTNSEISAMVMPYPELASVVFFCLKQTTFPRSWCIHMVSSPWFERVSMMVILLNCVTLGMYQPCENIDCSSQRCQILQAFDALIYIFFAVEMVVKMVALGIFGRRCYLGDTWNRLDFFIVMAGVVEYSLDLQNINLTAIRTVRVLRPLKAINRVPSMRILVNLLLDTLPMLGNVLLLCFFVFFIFGIIGVQLWAGLLRNRCYPDENFTLSTGMSLPNAYYALNEEDERPFICSLPQDNGIMSCSDVPARREGGRECCLDVEDAVHLQAIGLPAESLLNASSGIVPGLCVNWNRYYTQCRTGSTNPHKGAINFDNIGYAWIVIFQVITLEGWVEIMYYVMDAHSFYNFIYFILLIIVGSFFMINLCLVVIATQFSETKQREHQLMQEQRARCLSSSTLASLAEPGDCYEELFQLACHLLRKARRHTAAFFRALIPRPRQTMRNQTQANVNGRGERNQRHHPGKRASHCPHHMKFGHVEGSATLTSSPATEECLHCVMAQPLSDGEGPVGTASNQDTEEGSAEDKDKQAGQSCGQKQEKECKGKCNELWKEIRIKLWGIVESKYFNRGIMIAILINTISMGIEHHEQPDELTNVLEICNIVFTSMFALEMILKLTAFGCFNYLHNPYNIFDGIIVIISVCEIVGQSDGGLSVLRTFRLLRVLKLVRFMPALRRQLVVLMKTMDNVATFCMLLMLFIFIFSILGMHIFGCKFSIKTEAGDTVPDRKNFDSLLWAIVTVFQILTQEDWNVVLYNGMASTTPLAALYFVALMTFGNYVLFNLLVAILVEGFQAEGDANRSYSDDEVSSNYEESIKHKDSLQLSDPKLCALTPNGHLEMSNVGGGRINLEEESKKSSFTSLSKSSLEQRSFSLRHGRNSLYRHWGRPHPQSAWSRRSSWNSVGRTTRGLNVGGSLRVRGPYSHPAERESLLSPRPPLSHQPPLLSRRYSLRHDRRALSLELPERLQLPVPPTQRPPLTRKKSVCGEQHHDCNGKAPSRQTAILSEVYPQLSARKDKPHLDEETDYSLCFRIQKMIEVYRPDLCETREDWSVYLFSPENKFRLTCQKIIAHKLFDYVVLAFIFLNCITVALERPRIHQGSLERVFLTISNYIFTAIFVAEMTVKVVSMGLYWGDRAYLRSSWNILDGFLVFVSLIDIVVSMAGGAKILGVLRVLRLLRTLRPLRVISRAPGLKLVVETLITSLKPIGNIVLICCAFFIIFGILGVQLFKGKFYYCVGLDVKNITNKSDCLLAKYKWVHHKYNFDNLGQALMSLFVLASKDGWVNIMYHGLDAVGIDQQPVINNNPWMLLYFISFLLIVSFFVLNMFVGVVVENFHKCRQHQEVEEAKRREEKRLRRMEKKRRKAQKLPYYAGYGHVRLMIHSFCTSHYLDLFITLIICINVITMSLEHYDQPKSLETALKYCNYFFSSTFVVEATLKLIAFGFRRFFKDRWNQLDLAIVLLSVMGITLEEIEINASLPINPTIIRIMRVLRIARVLKLLKMATGMRALLDTVVQALPQVGNLGLLFMLLFFIYAALGVELFGELVCNADYPCEGMSRHATFENFGMAFLTLFQVSTGDNWNGIMKDTLRECPPGDTYSCNGSLQFISPMYFVSFVLTAQFVLINVVVAVLMKHLDDSNKEAQEEAEMDAEIELELAQGGLCCLGGLAAAAGPGIGVGTGGCGGGGGDGERPGAECGNRPGGIMGAHVHAGQSGYTSPSVGPEAHVHRKLYSPAQENLWLDSVSLLIKDSLESEMQMIDNLSGSVFHHYSSPAVCRDCRCQPAEIQFAEVEQASLMSEQLSDKSSSPALPDDLSLDDHSVYQLLVRDSREEQGSNESQSLEELQVTPSECRGYHSKTRAPSLESEIRDGLPNSGLQKQNESLQHLPWHSRIGDGSRSSSRRDERACSPLFHLPAEFFHPATAVPQGGLASGVRQTGWLGSRLTSPASWASLRSPGANCRVMGLKPPSQSESSLAMGSSQGSLQTMLVKDIGFSISPHQDLSLPPSPLCPLPNKTSSDLSQSSHSNQVSITHQTSRGHQRSQSSCDGSPSPSRLDSMDPSDEDTGTARGSSQAVNSKHLSETLSSLSLSSLSTPGSLVPPLAKKCNSTGSLEQGNLSERNKNRQNILNPWTTEENEDDGETGIASMGIKSSSQTMDARSRKNR